jgi:carnitine O-acetyltransferase
MVFVVRARGSGLRKVLKEGESVPEIFEDPVVKRAGHWVLSTSALFSKHLREYGWGEVRLTFFFGAAALTSCYAGRARWLWCSIYHRLRWYVSMQALVLR